MEYFGKNLRYLRKKRGLTQAEIKYSLGIGATTWSGYETEKSFPNLKVFHKISEYFQVSERDLLNFDLSKGDLNGKRKKENEQKEGDLKGDRTGDLMASIVSEEPEDYYRIEVPVWYQEVLKSKEETIRSQADMIQVLKEHNTSLNTVISMLTAENNRLKKGKEAPNGDNMEESPPNPGRKTG